MAADAAAAVIPVVCEDVAAAAAAAVAAAVVAATEQQQQRRRCHQLNSICMQRNLNLSKKIFKKSMVYLVDIDKKAIKLSKENLKLNNILNTHFFLKQELIL